MPERNCRTCSVNQKREWGCEAKLKAVKEDGTEVWENGAWIPVDIDGEPQMLCPRRPILDDPAYYSEVFSRYRAYDKGMLPERGGLEDQPAKLMQLFRVIESATITAEAAKAEARAAGN